METEDQAQGSTDQVGAEGQQNTEATQTGQDQEQSSGDQTSLKQDKTYRVGGRELTPDELFEKHVALEKDYTQKSQRLSRIERSFEGGEVASKASQEVTANQNITPEVREAVLGIVRPEMEKELDRRMKARDTQAFYESKFDKLSRTWDGRDGRPKFDPGTDRDRIMEIMRDPDNRDYDPETLYEKLHKTEIRDWEVKQALKKQRGTTPTEKTGAPTSKRETPKKGAPKTLGEASARLYERLKQEG